MHNKMSGLLMEVGAGYSKNRLRGKKYFHEPLVRLDEIPPSVKELLMCIAIHLNYWPDSSGIKGRDRVAGGIWTLQPDCDCKFYQGKGR